MRLGPAIGVLVLASVLVVAAPAAAANLVPNPGFESACGSETEACSWEEIVNTSMVIQRDPTIGQGGSSASYRLERLASGIDVRGQTDCIAPHPVTGGSASYSFWYRTADPRVTNVIMYATFFNGVTCTGNSVGLGVQQTSPDTNGDWQLVTLVRPVEAMYVARPALRFQVEFRCGTGGCPGAQVHFDDLVFEQTPTAVRIAAIRTQRTSSGVRLRWRTAFETETLGFNVYRQQKGKLVKVNRTLIPSVFGGTAAGHAYSWLDREAPNGATSYRLQAVSLNGTTSWAGAAMAAR